MDWLKSCHSIFNVLVATNIPIISSAKAKMKRYKKYIQLAEILLPEIIISLPKVEEYDTGFQSEMICIQGGKFSFGNSAVLENIKGRLIKFEITVGICQSELFIVIRRYIDERPKLSKNNATTNAVKPIGSGNATPNSMTPKNTIGT